MLQDGNWNSDSFILSGWIQNKSNYVNDRIHFLKFVLRISYRDGGISSDAVGKSTRRVAGRVENDTDRDGSDMSRKTQVTTTMACACLK